MSIKTLKTKQSGFSVIEVLIAMTLLLMCLTAVILVAFTNQSVLVDSQNSENALGIAQGLLEYEQSQVFGAVSGFSFVSGIYTETVTVQSQDSNTKLITVTISWGAEGSRTQTTSLSAIVTNYKNFTS